MNPSQTSEEMGRVPLDKEKGFVKDEDILSGAEHRFFWTSEEAWGLYTGISPLNHFSGGSLHRTIDTTNCIMISLYGHPAAGSVGKWETPEVFPKALAPSSAQTSLDARAPNQSYGLNIAQGHPRVALDTNDLWIADIAT
jgi:hypothetical protein